MNKKELWLRLKAYQFDHIVAPGIWDHLAARFGHTNPSLKAFARKIARKHDWKNHFASRTLSEYKKFVYLGLVSDFEVTPSKVIDVVWHEHLLFSKAYRDFCNEVIEHQFDHHPELLSMIDQTGRFSAQYMDTLDLYRTEFGIEPPADIWGITKFDKEQLEKDGYRSTKKKRNTGWSDDNSSYYTDTTPLYFYFDTEPATNFTEFSGYSDGDSGGGGGSSTWDDSNNDSSSDSSNDSGSDGGGCSSVCGGGGD
jgi:hypothetical protein